MKIDTKLKKQISTVVGVAQKLVIQDEKSKAKAAELLSQLNVYNDSLKESKETITKPINEALRNARALFAPLEGACKEAIDTLRGGLGEYQTRLVKEAKEREAELLNKVGEGDGEISIEEASKKIVEVQISKRQSMVVGDSGMVKFRTDKVLVIVDEKQIPREYLVVDEKRILAVLKAGGAVAGCKLDEVQVPVNYR